jgi:predicted ATPase/DNA-binding XRE family transcriptional regulator
MEQRSFGLWLRLKRKALDLTREELAERLGYSAATVRKIEDEERRPSVQIAERLSEFFNIPQNERESFLRFARGDWKSAPAEMDVDVPWRISTKSPRSNIPAPTTSLIAREQEIAQVRDYLARDDIRLVTVMGPPGIGKTRLSIEAARAVLTDFPEGVFFAALAPLEDPALIAMTIARALGYVGAQNTSTEEQLKEGIGNKRVLIVLDNCEHLIEDVAWIVSILLSGCPRLTILTTSRESLRIPGEWLYPVPALDLPVLDSISDFESVSSSPALALFVERARAVRPGFRLNSQNIEALLAICARLDGLPLAIELMAARMRMMSPEVLLERMDNRMILSADGMRAPSPRQKTLQNAIDWSYSLLSVEEQKLFAYLSVFSGGFALEAAEALFSPSFTEKPVSELIASLLDKSLLQYDLDEGNVAHYSMLATIQEFARMHLQRCGQEAEIRDLHLAYFLGLVRQAHHEIRGPNQLEWLHRLESTRENLRAALDRAIETGQTQTALQFACKLDWFWIVRSDHTEGRQWLERVLQMSDAPRYPSLQAWILAELAHHVFLQIGENRQRPFIDRALSIARTHVDEHNTARALVMLGLALIEEQKHEEAQSTLEESIALFQKVNDEWGYAHALMCLGYGLNEKDDLINSLSVFEQALTVSGNIGDRFLMNVILRGMAIIYWKQGNLDSAVAKLRESLQLAQQLDSKLEIAGTLSRWGKVEQRAGNLVRAVRLYLAANNLFDNIGAWANRYEFNLEQDLAPCRAALSEAEYAKAVEEGRAMTMEQAIAYALNSLDA